MNELNKLKNHIKAQDEIIADLSDDVIELSRQVEDIQYSEEYMLVREKYKPFRKIKNPNYNPDKNRNRHEF